MSSGTGRSRSHVVLHSREATVVPATIVATHSHENSELDASMTRRLRASTFAYSATSQRMDTETFDLLLSKVAPIIKPLRKRKNNSYARARAREKEIRASSLGSGQQQTTVLCSWRGSQSQRKIKKKENQKIPTQASMFHIWCVNAILLLLNSMRGNDFKKSENISLH
ncbi:unnamed protein product [Trichogramma brassicae]|uniref:Uncharacterized protein n=1 Tax=Trichogramma brassicae TaxID=86971 RepID=A0A6H5I318_9HYME|nr:unnamed protein product [Trichogramma brassicae]